MNTGNETQNMVKTISSETLKAVQESYTAWQTNDFAIIDKLFSPEWQDIPSAHGQEAGPEGLKNLITFFRQNFPDIVINVHDIFGTVDRIAVRAELTFTHNKEFMGIPPINKKVTVSMLELHHLENNMITHTWHMEDWFGLLLQSKTLD
jgi:predicted ester cyclase